MNSIANLAMVPMQDYLELSNQEGRMNTPCHRGGQLGLALASPLRYRKTA